MPGTSVPSPARNMPVPARMPRRRQGGFEVAADGVDRELRRPRRADRRDRAVAGLEADAHGLVERQRDHGHDRGRRDQLEQREPAAAEVAGRCRATFGVEVTAHGVPPGAGVVRVPRSRPNRRRCRRRSPGRPTGLFRGRPGHADADLGQGGVDGVRPSASQRNPGRSSPKSPVVEPLAVLVAEAVSSASFCLGQRDRLDPLARVVGGRHRERHALHHRRQHEADEHEAREHLGQGEGAAAEDGCGVAGS